MLFLDQPKKQPQSVPAVRPKEEVAKESLTKNVFSKKEESKDTKVGIKEEPLAAIPPAKPTSKEPLPPISSTNSVN